MRPFDIEIAVSTCDRSPQYVHQTLENMVSSDRSALHVRKRLVVSGASAAYLERWSMLEIETWTPDEAAAAPATPQHRTGQNFMRQLRGEDAPLVALQDDLAFSSRWLEKALETATAIEKKHPRFVLALYAPYKLRGLNGSAAPYSPFRFYGNQALLMPAVTRRELLAFCEQTSLGPDDMMVKAFLSQDHTKLFARNPNVVQHVGETSAVEQRFHRSPTFKP